jgi:2'-5' RNA ligase
VDRVGGRSAIVVPFTLPVALERIRQGHVDGARLGVPAHVTLLFPFVPAIDVQPADVQQAAETVRRTPCFDVEFREVTTFDPLPGKEGVVWLAPEPAGPFVEMTHALAERFPGYLPYEGIHDTVIPHLTLANVDVDAPTLVAAARPTLPFATRVASAVLLVEDNDGRWRIADELPLG